MTTRYSSFLIRYWQLAGGARRIVVEHVQSGDGAIVQTIDAATTWIDCQVSDVAHAAETQATDTVAPLPGDSS